MAEADTLQGWAFATGYLTPALPTSCLLCLSAESGFICMRPSFSWESSSSVSPDGAPHTLQDFISFFAKPSSLLNR